jgi:hypothetical protein
MVWPVEAWAFRPAKKLVEEMGFLGSGLKPGLMEALVSPG